MSEWIILFCESKSKAWAIYTIKFRKNVVDFFKSIYSFLYFIMYSLVSSSSYSLPSSS